MSNVVVYTSKTCKYCSSVKELLNNNDIEYDEKDITVSAEYRNELIKKGYMSVPILIADGVIVEGFKPKRLKELFDK
jgi:glutaredoxin 3